MDAPLYVDLSINTYHIYERKEVMMIESIDMMGRFGDL